MEYSCDVKMPAMCEPVEKPTILEPEDVPAVSDPVDEEPMICDTDLQVISTEDLDCKKQLTKVYRKPSFPKIPC